MDEHAELYLDEDVRQLLERAERRLHGKIAASAAGEDKPKAAKMALDLASPLKVPRLSQASLDAPYVTQSCGSAHADSHRLVNPAVREAANSARKIEDPAVAKSRKVEEKQATAGEPWFNLPRTDLTPELKRDLQLLKMRGFLDPQRHYKKESASNCAPEFSQVGTIIEGSTEYFSARIPKRERKRTFVEEILEGESSTGRFKKKYNDIQAFRTQGKKAHYKKVKEKRFH